MTDPLAALRARFLERCRSDLAELSARAVDDPQVALVVHRLAGAAGSFGFPDLSAAAVVVDQRLRDRTPPSPEALSALHRALQAAIAEDAPPE